MLSKLSVLISFLMYIYSLPADGDCLYKTTSNPKYGYITNPPDTYYNCCQWIIKLGQHTIIEIRLEVINLYSGDYIVIYDGIHTGAPVLATIHGKIKARKYTTSGGSALIYYHRNSEINFRRISNFNLTYQIKGICIPELQLPCSLEEVTCFDVRYERCDTIWHCPLTGRDEENCTNCLSEDSRSDTFYYPCSTVKSQCYSRSERCNGIVDCENVTDELNCDPQLCGAHNNAFLCKSSPSRCISISQHCDGSQACADGSDENNCQPTTYFSSMYIRSILISSLTAMLCCLMLVLGLICICRLHKMRLRYRRLTRGRGHVSESDSAVQQMIDDQMRRRPPPPNYNYAMRHSVPFSLHEDAQRLLNNMNRKVSSRYLKQSNKRSNYISGNGECNRAFSADEGSNRNTHTNSTAVEEPDDSDVQLLIAKESTSESDDSSSDVELLDCTSSSIRDSVIKINENALSENFLDNNNQDAHFSFVKNVV